MPSFDITAIAANDPQRTFTPEERAKKKAEALNILARRFQCRINPQGHLEHDSLNLAIGSMHLSELDATIMIRMVEVSPAAC
jgi:hypothetical protein